MFRGNSHLNIDSKGRLAVPAKYREALQASCQGRLVLTVDRDRCLLLFPMPEWERIEQEIAALPSLNRQARRVQRLLIGNAQEVELDAQGRILLPAPLREYAHLDKRVVMTGQFHKFEIWDQDTWKENVDTWAAEERDQDDDELPDGLDSLSY